MISVVTDGRVRTSPSVTGVHLLQFLTTTRI
jgi:hypothetical protein